MLDLGPSRWLPKMEPDIVEIRRHMRRTKEAYRSPKHGLVAEGDTEQPEQQSLSLPERAQTGHELSAPCSRQTYPVVR